MKIEVPDDVILISIGLECPKCHKKWGIRIDRLKDDKIPSHRYICDRCYQAAKAYSQKEEIK